MKLEVRQDGCGHILCAGVKRIPCRVGRSGIIAAADKREGDGATPAGTWPLRQLFYRRDRLALPATRLAATALGERDGWCDDPAAAEYNLPVPLPFAASHETLWRLDHAYDVIIPLGYNDAPPVPGLGSAIFFHCLEDGRTHTEGCVAIDHNAMLDLLPALAPGMEMIIHPPSQP